MGPHGVRVANELRAPTLNLVGQTSGGVVLRTGSAVERTVMVCAACSRDNPPQAKLYLDCGARLAMGFLAVTGRLLTIDPPLTAGFATADVKQGKALLEDRR